MKNKTVKKIRIIVLAIFGIVAIAEVFEGAFEQNMQEFFKDSGLRRQSEPISTPQQAKKLAQKIFYKNFGLESVTTYRPYSVSHDDEAGIWLVYAAPGIYKIMPFMCYFGYCMLVTDDGYIIASFIY